MPWVLGVLISKGLSQIRALRRKAAMWKDTSTYSSGDRVRAPYAFTTKAGDLEVVIVHGHRAYPGKWVMHCYVLGIDTRPLESCRSAEDAKTRAVAVVRARLLALTEYARELG